jgi:ribonuclease P/MRP protein subunit POP5
MAWAALSFVTHLPEPHNTPCVFQVVKVSGTIRKSEEEAIKRARETVRRAQNDLEAEGGAAFNALMLSAAGECVESPHDAEGSEDKMDESESD